MVNRFLRTAPTRTLLGGIAVALAIIGGGTAIALAAQSGGPVPKPKPLAIAVRDALRAPTVKGFSADISFTNGLLGASELQGSDPLLQGGSGHIWVSNEGQFRVELYGENGDPEIVVDHTSWWVSDPTLQTVYEGKLPPHSAEKQHRTHHESLPTIAQIQAGINRLARHLILSGAAPTDVGGQPTYTVSASPKQTGGLVGQLQLAWDAIRGVPLRVAVYARGDGKPVLALSATNISYGSVPASVFRLAPPSGYGVVSVATPRAQRAGRSEKAHGRRREVSGVAAVSKRLGFRLSAPATLAGRRRQSVALVGKGAVLVYGQGLGAIGVLEEPASAAGARQLQLSRGTGDGQRGVILPTFSVHGRTAQELDTALGTLVRFNSGGVTYSVAGSVKPAVARAAARGL